MNKYIYKIRFVFIEQEQKLCVNMNFIKQQTVQLYIEQTDGKQIMKSMNASCLFSWKFLELRIFKLHRKTILQQTLIFWHASLWHIY